MSRAQRRQKPSSRRPPGLDPKRRLGQPGRAASAPIAQAHSFWRFRGAGRSEERAVGPAPAALCCHVSGETRVTWGPGGGAAVGREWKEEGEAGRGGSGDGRQKAASGGEKKKGQGAARAPASRSAGWASASAARWQLGPASACRPPPPALRVPPAGLNASRPRPGQFLSPRPGSRLSLPASSLLQPQDAECDQHGEGKGSGSGRVPDAGPQGKPGGSGLLCTIRLSPGPQRGAGVEGGWGGTRRRVLPLALGFWVGPKACWLPSLNLSDGVPAVSTGHSSVRWTAMEGGVEQR